MGDMVERPDTGITFIGPALDAVDENGMHLAPIATVFPSYRVLISGRGIHLLQVQQMVEYQKNRSGGILSEAEEERVLEDAVALLIRDHIILIRSDPENMDRILAADSLLQETGLFDKSHIQFTGVHQEAVRKRLRLRGESWRISPPPYSDKEIARCIKSSMVTVGTRAVYYQNAPTGGRFLTFEEFSKILPMLREDPVEARARLQEIVKLTTQRNAQLVFELSFFLHEGEHLSSAPLVLVLELLSEDLEKATQELGEFTDRFRELAGPDLLTDGSGNKAWRTNMFCRLYDISPSVVEEWALGLSPEFFLNVRWMPGARKEGTRVFMEEEMDLRVRKLLWTFIDLYPDFVSVNIGRVEAAQGMRNRRDQEREVMLVVVNKKDGSELIHILRRVKYDVMHRLKSGKELSQAISETEGYIQYIFDRLEAAKALGLSMANFAEIQLEEDLPGLGKIPLYYFDREYIAGLATDKIPSGRLSRPGFIINLSELLGHAAAFSMILGRSDPDHQEIYFDDGDEVVLFDPVTGLPNQIILSETTGSFSDWMSPICNLLPECLRRLEYHLHQARAEGVKDADLKESVAAFSAGLTAEILRMQEVLRTNNLRALFRERSHESGGIWSRWMAMLDRLEGADVQKIQDAIKVAPCLSEFL